MIQATTDPDPGSEKRFRVALSFPGERRDFVKKVADYLCERLGKDKVLYDQHFEAEFALINLDTHLQRLYHDDSDLLAVFLCAEYAEKEWCGLEWRAIRDLIKKGQDSAIMLLWFDDAEIDGLYSIDGYVDIADREPEEIAALILERVGTIADTDVKTAEPAPPKTSVHAWYSPQWPITDPDIFGRDDELALLDAAWDEEKLNVVTLVAAGGVGKTALVNRWIHYHMQPENWRGAARVFGWSFYSQGAEEGRQSSADMFIDRALRWFGDEAMADTATPAYEKGQRLAVLVKEQRALLLLDGAEPLQEPPGVEAQHPGRVKDPGLQGLLRGLALNNPGLCVVSTRIEVADLRPYAGAGGSVLSENLDDLTPQAGAEYLTSLGVTGSDDEMRKASDEFGNHALALTLLGGLLVRYRQNDVRKRDTVLDIFRDPEEGGHAKRVMKWYAKKFKGEAEGQVLRILGLFDRPVEPGALKALLSGESINGLTTRLNGISTEDWIDVLTTLRELRLIACSVPPPLRGASRELKSQSSVRDGESGEALDCHPLVREYFGDRLSSEQPDAWIVAHDRLYEYYRKLPAKELPDTADEMAPLFQAVVHGCHAGKYQKALDEVYWPRIQRGQMYYAGKKLGAHGAELSALASLFDAPWRDPVRDLPKLVQAFLLNQTAYSLRALGRLAEAVAPMKKGVERE